MSWHGFKKVINRATVQVMQSMGSMEKTVDKTYEEEERRYKAFETKVEKLHRESKGFLDSLRSMTLAQKRIAETVDQFYDDADSAGSQQGYAGASYKLAVERLDAEVTGEFDTGFRMTVLDPLGRLIQVFPDFNESIKKRQKKLLDYDRLNNVTKKLAEKPSEDPNKYPRALQESNQAKELYESLNQTLITEIPKLIDLRVPFLDPTFEALVKSQLEFNETAFKNLDSIKGTMAYGRNGMEGEGLEGQVESVLQQMRDLTICASA
ncbi:hypothetical protein HDV05_002178 [Chytridiales sp. JEL 0842]|nr:hypothetical protein HDV05_002178 [Chytridiales sp. JEL 0842]